MMAVSEEKWKAVLSAISSGLSNVRACDLVGVSKTAFYDKKKADAEFADRVKEAEAKFMQVQLSKIQGADQWQSAAWILERKFPDEFKERKHVEHEGIEINISDASKGGA